MTDNRSDELDADRLTWLFSLRGVAVPPDVAADLVEPVRALLAQAANVRAALHEMKAPR